MSFFNILCFRRVCRRNLAKGRMQVNILFLRYAVEIAKTMSISKAAENLYMGQPNLSRAIKELEKELNISIFNRTTKGISITPEGEEFLQYAREIIRQVDMVENRYRNYASQKQNFSICVPRVSYISYAFSEFAKNIRQDSPAEFFYKETNSMDAINNLVREECNLAIIRYQSAFDVYFKNLFTEKKIASETVADFSYVLLTSAKSPIAGKTDLSSGELSGYIEISHPDPYVPSVPQMDVRKAEFSDEIDKRIFVFERASQLSVLENVPGSFMWTSPIPQPLLKKYNLVQTECRDNPKKYKDVLLYREDYRLSEWDSLFITELCEAKRQYL